MRVPAACVAGVGLLCVVYVSYVSAKVDEDKFPDFLAQCFGYYKNKTTLSKTPAGAIQCVCKNIYSWVHAKELNINRGASQETINYVTDICQPVKQLLKISGVGRRKRQAPAHGTGKPGPLRVRKEIRMMTDKELETFFAAVNSAKRNSTIAPNKYDALAEFHTGMTSLSAHGGCNFHGWHRMYLLMFENALREEGPEFADVTIPYWDSRMESRMKETPTASALFSDRLMGSCTGQATGGIMGTGWNSSTGIITRNCNTDGPLFSDEMIHNVTRRTRLSQICGEDSAVDDDLEFHHNGAHRWIDGQMAMLATAVYDPIFWLHHNFVDLIWEMFRKNQKASGINPEDDYPENPVTMGAFELHLRTAEIGFAGMTVEDGLSEVFTSEWYEFAPPPTCTIGKQDCGSKYLKCVVDEPGNQGRRRAQCVARTLKEVEEWEEEQNRPPTPDCKPYNKTKDPKDPPGKVDPIKPVQNTFCMNGKSDIRQWVYIPVKVIVQRPPEYKTYNSYPVERGEIQKGRGDIYAPGAYSNMARQFRKAEIPAKYKDCQEPNEPTNTIYVNSNGLNYEGSYKEYAIIDRRLAVTVATAYIAVRRPMGFNDVSIALLHAQDKCGRVCKPICKVPGQEIYRPCSGAIKITGGMPLQFGNSFGDAVLNVWDFNTDANCPQLQSNQMIVSFYCDYKTDWMWPTKAPVKHTVTTRKVADPAPSPGLSGSPQRSGAEDTTVIPGCALGMGCVANQTCDAILPCRNGATVQCVNSCISYARCFNGRYYVSTCRRGEKAAPNGAGCVRGYCDYKNTGYFKYVQEQSAKRRTGRRGWPVGK